MHEFARASVNALRTAAGSDPETTDLIRSFTRLDTVVPTALKKDRKPGPR